MNEDSVQRDSLQYVRSGQGRGPETEFSGDESRALGLVNQKIAGARSLDEALKLLFESTRHILPCDRLSAAFLDEDRERLVSYRTLATYEPLRLKDGFASDLRGSSLQKVIESGTPRILDDLEAYYAAHPQSLSTRLLLEEGIHSSMTCPLVVDERIVGVLFRSSRVPSVYNQHHVRLHQAIEERLSQTVEKAYRIEQLTLANKSYMEMLGFVSHELKSPLAGLLMEGEVLMRGLAGVLTDQQKERVERIIRGGKYLNDLIREYLDLARLEGGDFVPAVRPGVDFIKQVVEPAEEIVEELLKARGMRLVHNFEAGSPRLDVDAGLLKIVLINLLGNAAKYGKEGGQVVLAINRTDENLVVSVWNEGIGFRDVDRPLLFRKFSRLPTPELKQVKGTGVGLYTSWRIVQIHNGRISARSEYGKWAEFTLEIPLVQPK
jgi:signal transduction histidine kinase